MVSKVAQDHHHQLLCLLIVYENTLVGFDIILKFVLVERENGMPLVSLIGLFTLIDMGLPQVCDGFGLDDPFVCGRIGSR